MPTSEQLSPFAAQVGHWKADVSAFFNNDWSRLRTLIQSLENESWGTQRSAGNSGCRSGLAETTELPLTFAAVDDSNNNNKVPAGIASSAERAGSPVDRLADLSRQIEWRLQLANGLKEQCDADA
jgi:hypothetical protein